MTDQPSAILQAGNISVRVGRRTILDQVDLALTRGRIHAIVGPNGAGKSTLLRVLTGEIRPTDGQVTFNGRALDDFESTDLAKQRAFLPQSSSLSFPFTIREVVGIGRFPHRETQKETNLAVEKALRKVDLLGRADEGYLHLSGGEKQRVHLARALAQLGTAEGRVLMLDEPTASLDMTFQHQVFAIAREWAENGAAVLLVLHDLNQTMRFAHQVTVLHQGRVASHGPPREVLSPALIRQVYHVNAHWLESDGHRLLAIDGPIQAR